jgi:hypothetical protein
VFLLGHFGLAGNQGGAPMLNDNDQPMYRTFEEFEREELRRADAVGTSVETLFDDMFVDELDFDATGRSHAGEADADDEEE